MRRRIETSRILTAAAPPKVGAVLAVVEAEVRLRRPILHDGVGGLGGGYMVGGMHAALMESVCAKVLGRMAGEEPAKPPPRRRPPKSTVYPLGKAFVSDVRYALVVKAVTCDGLVLRGVEGTQTWMPQTINGLPAEVFVPPQPRGRMARRNPGAVVERTEAHLVLVPMTAAFRRDLEAEAVAMMLSELRDFLHRTGCSRDRLRRKARSISIAEMHRVLRLLRAKRFIESPWPKPSKET